MPSLPTDNSRKESSTDAFRRYLPSKYVHGYDTNGATNGTICCHFFKFLFILYILILALLFPTWLGTYFKDKHADEFANDNIAYIDDAYWFLLQTLFCFCVILILYRRIPREHTQHCASLFGSGARRWYVVLFLVSFGTNGCMFLLDCILLRLHLDRDVKSFVHISCDVFICKYWDFYLIWMFIIFPVLSLLLTCALMHWMLFGFEHNSISSLCCCCFLCCCRSSSSSHSSRHAPYGHNTTQHDDAGSFCCAGVCYAHTREPNYYAAYAARDAAGAGGNGSNKSRHSEYNSHRGGAEWSGTEQSLNTINSSWNPSSPGQSNYHQMPRVVPYYPSTNININVSVNGGQAGGAVGPVVMGDESLYDTELQIMHGMHGMHHKGGGSQMSQTPSELTGSVYNVGGGGGGGGAKSVLSGSTGGAGGGHFNKKIKFPEMRMLKYVFWYCFLLCFSLLALFVACSLHERYYKSFFRTGFGVLLMYSLLAKWLLKKVARLIDRKRYHTHRYDKYTYFSMEVLTEFLISCVFWIAMRSMLLFGLPNSNIEGVYMVFGAHMVTEIFASGIRPSASYFNVTKLWQSTGCYQGCLKWFFYGLCGIDKRHDKSVVLFWNLNDDSNLMQWRIRNGLDITMRLIAAMMSTFLLIGQLALRGDGSDDGNHSKGWIFDPIDYLHNSGTGWLLITTAVEAIFFLILYFYNVCFINFCILEPFYVLCQENEALLMFCLVAMLIEAYWFPNVFTGDYSA